MSHQPLRDVAYAATYLGVAEDTVYRLVETRQLAFVDIAARGRGKRIIRFLDTDLDAFVTRRRVQAVAPASEPAEPTMAQLAPRAMRRARRAVVLTMDGAGRYA